MKSAFPLLSFLAALGIGWIFTPAPKEKPSGKTELSTRSLHESDPEFASKGRERTGEIARLTTREEQVHQLIALASSIPVGDIAEWHRSDLINALDDDLETLFSRITSERWLEANPKEFMEWATMMNYRQADLHLAQWAINDPEGANDFVKGLPRSNRAYKISRMISEMAKSDPDLALKFLERNLLGSSNHDSYHLKSALTSFAKDHLEAILAARESWPKAARDQASTVIAGVLFKKDFAKGLSFLESEGLDWKSMANSNDQNLAEALIKNRDQLPEGWLSKIIHQSSWAFISAKNGLALFESDPEALGLDSRSLANLAANAGIIPMTGKNPERLMAVINGGTISLETRQSILRSKIGSWADGDSDGLREWLGTLNDPELHAIADQGLVEFDSQPDSKPSVADNIAKVVGGSSLDYTLIRSISRWTPAETGKAVAAFRSLSPQEQQATFTSLQMALNNAPSNFDFFKEVFAEAAKLPAPDDENNQMRTGQNFQRFSSSYANVEPAKAAEWASQLPEGSGRQSAIQGVVQAWKNYSPSEAESWIRTLPANDQDAARKGLEAR